MKKILGVALGTMLLGTTVNVFAMDNTKEVVNDDDITVIEVNTEEIGVLEEINSSDIKENDTAISPFVSTSLSGTIAPGKYVKSSSSYYFTKGESILLQNMTWNPAGHKVRIGFISASTGTAYWSPSYTGGNKSNVRLSLGGASGNYYIAIESYYTNVGNVSVVGQFQF